MGTDRQGFITYPAGVVLFCGEFEDHPPGEGWPSMGKYLSSRPRENTHGGAVLLYNPFEDPKHSVQIGQLMAAAIVLHQAGLDIPLFITWDGEKFVVSTEEPTGEAAVSWFMKIAPDAVPAMMRLIPRENWEAVRAFIEDVALAPVDPDHDPDPEFN